MYNPIDPETHLRNVAAETRRTLEANRRLNRFQGSDLPHHPRRIRFRHT